MPGVVMWDFVTIVQVNILLLSDFLEEVLNQIILKAESEPMLQNDAEIKFDFCIQNWP